LQLNSPALVPGLAEQQPHRRLPVIAFGGLYVFPNFLPSSSFAKEKLKYLRMFFSVEQETMRVVQLEVDTL
jgi:hypothetical protein